MRKSIVRLGVLGLMAAIMAGAQVNSFAQITNKVAADKKAGAAAVDAGNTEKSAKAGPFHGKLAAVDKVAKTITVGKRTFQITSTTKIKKSGNPATLEEGVVGEMVSGYVKPTPEGKLAATTVNFGPKPAPNESEKPKAAPEKEKQAK